MIYIELFQERDIHFQTELLTLDSAMANEDWSATSESLERLGWYELAKPEKREVYRALEETFNLSKIDRRYVANLLRN